MDLTRKALATIFPILLLFGFSATSGVFLLQPVTERVSKMKQMLIMQGMSNTIYWLGLYVADLILLLFPFFLFSLIVLVVQIEGFYQEYGRLMVIILNFGGVLITFVYLISTFFKDVVTASKCIAPILILVGNVLPLGVAAIIMDISNYGTDAMYSGGRPFRVFDMIFTILYFTNPFVTFLVNTYTLLDTHFKDEKNRAKQEYCASVESINNSKCCTWEDSDGTRLDQGIMKDDCFREPDYLTLFYPTSGMYATFGLGVILCLLQAIFYLSLTILIEHRRAQSFREKSGEVNGQLQEPQLQTFQDVENLKMQVEQLRPTESGTEWPLITKNITKIYSTGGKNFIAVNDLTVGVKKGSIIGLLGPNGAGKSTSFSMLAMQQERS